jgi:hypothetical protein
MDPSKNEESVRPQIDEELNSARLIGLFGAMLFAFLIALMIWWVLYEYRQDPSQIFGLGFWKATDRPSWLPNNSLYGPLIGQHYFGDFFQLFYAIETHHPYTNAIVPTSMPPGYLLPPLLVSWLPYPTAGYVYLVGLCATWLLPAILIARRSYFIAAAYLAGTTLTVAGLFSLDLGQPEIFLYVLSVIAFCLMLRGSHLSAIPFGLAVAIKPYMALFLLLYLVKREYRAAAHAVIIAVVVNIGAGVALVGTTVLRFGFWMSILHAAVGYETASTAVWGFPQLRDDGSIFGIAYSLGVLRVPLISPVCHTIAGHYAVFTIVALVVLVAVFLEGHTRMSLEMQWLYLAIGLVLILSYGFAYVWLLLLVPFAGRAIIRGPEPVIPSGRGLGLFDSRGFVACVVLCLAPYPANLALPVSLGAANPAYGPDGNTLMTPALLLMALLLLVWNARPGSHIAGGLARSAVAVEGRSGSVFLNTVESTARLPIVGAIIAETFAALICFVLSSH